MPIVDIKGIGNVDFPDSWSHDQIVDAITNQVIPQYKAMIEPAGIKEAGVGGVKRNISSLTTGVQGIGDATEAGKAGVERGNAITERSAFSPEKIKYLKDTEGYFSAAKEALKQVPGVITEQAPNLAEMFAGARAGAMAGAALPLPPQGRAIAGVVGGIAGGAAPSYFSQAGTNIERQAQEQIAAGKPVDVNAQAAYTTAAPQAALDYLTDRFAFGRLLGITPKIAGTAAAEKIAERGLTRTLAGGAGKTIASEVPTEVTQQMLERYQAGLPLADEDALEEYRKTAYQTAMMGPLGSASNVMERSQARDVMAQDQQQRDAKVEEINRERQRQQSIVDEAQAQQQQAEQAQVNKEGAQAVQDEIARQAQETRAAMTDRLRQVLDQKVNTPEVGELNLTTKQGVRQALTPEYFDKYFPIDTYSEADRATIQKDLEALAKQVPTQAVLNKRMEVAQAKQEQQAKEDEYRQTFETSFGEHTLETLGIPKTKANLALAEPHYGKLTPDNAGTILNVMEEYKARNKGENDDKINAKIDDYLTKLYGSETETTPPAPPELDNEWRNRVSKRLPYIPPSPEGYRFTPEQQYQADLFHPGESLNNPALAPTRQAEQPQTDEILTDEQYQQREIQQQNEALRGGQYAPKTDRQLDFGFGPESDRNGYGTAPVGRETDVRYDRANPVTVGPIGGTAESTTTREAPEYGALKIRQKGWAQAKRDITDILADTERVTPEQQADGVNQIAERLEAFGKTPQEALDIALDLSKQHSQWPLQPEKKVRRRRAAAGEMGLKQEAVSETPETDDSVITYDDMVNTSESQFSRPANRDTKEVAQEPTTAEELASVVQKLVGPAQFRAKPPVIINDYSELPEHLRETAEAANAKAFVDPQTGQDYYVSSKINKGDEKGIILHERGAHVGLEKLIGKDRINALANRIYKWGVESGKTKADKRANRIAMEAIELADKSGEPIGTERHTQEVIAYFTELAVNKYGIDPTKTQPSENAQVATWLRQLWANILESIKKLHYNPNALTAHDVVEIVHGAARISTDITQNNTQNNTQYNTQNNTQNVQASAFTRSPSIEPTPAEKQAAAAAGRTVFTAKKDYTLADKVKARTHGNMLGWFLTKVVGGGASLELKGTDMFGPEARLNPETGKELGYLNYHRAVHDTDSATGAAANGYLDMDKEGVIHVVRSADNIKNLNNKADKIKAAMKANGMSEGGVRDAFSHMVLADRFKALQQQGIISQQEFTEADYKWGKELQRQYSSEYKEWQDMYQRIRGRTLDLMVKGGVFTREKANEFLNRYEYVPFNREQDPNVSDGTFLQGLLSAKREHHIEGSERQVKDVMENILDNQVWLMKRAIRNNTSNLIADTMDLMHRQNPLMGGKFVKADDKSKNVVEFLREGKIVKFKVEDKNDAAIFAAAPAVSNVAINFMRGFTSTLRKGVTLTPSFMYNQIIQDAMRAPVVAGTEAGMLQLLRKSAPEFVKNVHSETELAQKLRDAGIVGQIDYQDSYDNFKKELFGQERKGLGRALEIGERMAQSNDLATRAAVYDTVIKEGGSANDASLRALMMINFQNRGHSQFLNFLMALAPFVNSRIQGEYRLAMALTGRIPGVTKAHAKQLIAWRLAKMAAYTAIYAMAVSGDDDYERANEEVKNHNFLLGGVKIPVAPEFLPLKVAAEKSYRLLTDQEFETGSKAARAELSALAGLAFGVGDVTPTAIKPVLENLANFSTFTGRPLVGYTQLQQDTNMQFNESTSELSKSVSDLLQQVGGNTINISPIKLDNLIRGWFGSMGRDLLYTTDMMSGAKATPKPNQLPLVGAFFYDQEGGALKSDFYELKDAATKATNTLSRLKQTDPDKAREYMEANRPLLAMQSSIEAIGNQLDLMRRQKVKAIADDPDTARERISEIDTRAHNMLMERLPMLKAKLAEFQDEQ